MEFFEIKATNRTPHFVFDPKAGELTIRGCSIPENADQFYGPIHERMESYMNTPAAKTTVRVDLSYFNSSSAKYLLELMKKLGDLHDAGTSEILLEWCYVEDDLDQQEAGEDFKELLDFPVELIVVPDPETSK